MAMKFLCIVVFFVAFSGLNNVVINGAECGKATADQEAQKMQSCIPAVQNADAAVPAECCALASKMVDSPDCMCAVAYSQTIKSSGGTPENALSIPKRCGLANRNSGHKCAAGGVAIP